MTHFEKLNTVKVLLEDGGALPSDEKITTYLGLAKSEILEWIYHLVGGVPGDVTGVPTRYEPTQVYAVVAGFTQAGAEGTRDHSENGIKSAFRYSDMLDYIHNNVLPIVRVGAVSTL